MSRWCLLAGALLGAAHVVDAGWPLAWAGFALLAYALDADGPGQPEAPARAWRAIGVLVAAILTESIANAWLVSTAGSWLGLSLHLSLRLAAVACCLMGAMLAAPSILAALVLPSRWGSAWLPVTWALGEALRGRVSGVTTSDWLMVHWQSERALHALYWLGWYPALLVGLGCATCVGVLARRSRLLAAVALVVVCAVAPLPAVRTDPALVRGVALVRRSRLLAAVALVVVCAVAPLPAVRTDPALVRGVALVQVAGPHEAPAGVPEGVDLLVWPESSLHDHPTLVEGAIEGIRIALPLRREGLWHVVGLVTFTPRGEAQNSVCLVDPSGAVRRCRAKRDLVPVGERRFLGLLAGDGFRPGDATPYFRAPGRSLVPLVCLEGTHPWTARRGVEAGGALAVVVASDRPIAGNRVAQTQALASTVVMSAALRVPMLRATREGRSVLALPDGRYRLGPARRTAAVSW